MRGLTLIVIGLLLIAVLTWTALGLRQDPSNTASDAPNSPDRPTQQTASGEHTDRPDIPPVVRPVWNEWPVPSLALLITGEQHGYFEPCGCTANQMGGMARRADLASRLTNAGWPLRGIDLGDLARRSSRQAQVKFETSLQALRDLQYVAVGLGPTDLRLQPDFLLTQPDFLTSTDIPTEDAESLHFVAANLTFFDDPTLGTPVPCRLFHVGDARVGVTSVLTASTRQDVLPEGTPSDITWTEPKPALQEVMARFDEADINVRILLSHGSVEESKELAAAFPDLDLIVMAQGFSDPDPRDQPEQIGRTQLLQVGHKGKFVGVVGIYPQEEERLKFQLIPLERSEFEDAPSMIEHMRQYQQRLEEERISLADGAIAHPGGASFVGADACKDCHPRSWAVWESSGHAHAFDSLDPSHQRMGFERLNGVARMFDPECLSCHVTGWDPVEYIRYRSGFLNEEYAEDDDDRVLQQKLAGNQCENCHGPASRHLELLDSGDLDLAKKEVAVTLEQVKRTCYQCHDTDNSPDFEFDAYWELVKHYEE